MPCISGSCGDAGDGNGEGVEVGGVFFKWSVSIDVVGCSRYRRVDELFGARCPAEIMSVCRSRPAQAKDSWKPTIL